MRAALLVLAAIGSFCLLSTPASAQEANTAAPAFVGAAACKECHTEVFDAWQKTKHATALNRLSEAERAGGQCIRCHVTGPAAQVEAEAAKPSMPGIQCEACHGAGKAHVDSAVAGGPLPNLIVRKPKASECERCHNDKGPRFRGFMYDAMVGFSHRP